MEPFWEPLSNLHCSDHSKEFESLSFSKKVRWLVPQLALCPKNRGRFFPSYPGRHVILLVAHAQPPSHIIFRSMHSVLFLLACVFIR